MDMMRERIEVMVPVPDEFETDEDRVRYLKFIAEVVQRAAQDICGDLPVSAAELARQQEVAQVKADAHKTILGLRRRIARLKGRDEDPLRAKRKREREDKRNRERAIAHSDPTKDMRHGDRWPIG